MRYLCLSMAFIFIVSLSSFGLGYAHQTIENRALLAGYTTAKTVTIRVCSQEEALAWWAGKTGMAAARSNICNKK